MADIENYPITKIPVFSKEIPKVSGYYWWKEDFKSKPEIVELESEDGFSYVNRIGEDRPWMSGTYNMGLFSDKVKSLWN